MRFAASVKGSLVLALSAAAFFGACTSERQEAALESKANEPKPLAEVLTFPRPMDLYARAYPCFVYESTANVTVGTGDQGRSFSALALLKRNELGDFLLRREPLYPAPPTEVRVIGGKAYILTAARPAFVRTRYQPEFERWANDAFREVFKLFEENGFMKAGEGVLKESILCWNKPGGEICVDPSTGLPVKGDLTVPRREKPPIRVEFKVGAYGPKTIAIPSP